MKEEIVADPFAGDPTMDMFEDKTPDVKPVDKLPNPFDDSSDPFADAADPFAGLDWD